MYIGRFKTNNIYNEDCYKAIKDIPDKSIDLIYTDIPYLMQYKWRKNEISNNVKNTIEEMQKNKKFLLDGINYDILKDFCRVLKKIHVYIWCSKSQMLPIMDFFINEKKCNFNILCWCKNNPVPFTNSPFLSDIEYCLAFYETGVNFNLGMENKTKFYNSFINQKDKAIYNHPTIKPLIFVKKQILNGTKKNDVVLDCFIGSGTTAVACKETGRQYLGFEINKEYFKIAVDRLNELNQKERKKIENGYTTIFDFMGE